MKNTYEMTREELIRFTEKEIEQHKKIVEYCSTFEGWSKQFHCWGVNVISEGVEKSKLGIEQTFDAIVSGINVSTTEDYNEIMLDYFKKRRDLYKPLLKKSLEWEELTLNPDAGLVEYLEEMYDKAYEIFTQCGFKGIARTEAIIDVSASNDDYGYYSANSKNIMIRENILRLLDEDAIIEIILHEMIHAFVDRFFGDKEVKVFSDDSIIFSAFVARLNRKLKRLGYNLQVGQNESREAESKEKFGKEVARIADCRKGLLTAIDEAKQVISEFMDKYGKIEVLGA